jgi:DNA-binding PadR family transcriptional regulator
MLTKLEEMVLLTILKLKDHAYIVTIRDQIENYTNKTISFGALHVSLTRLIRYKYLNSQVGESFSMRGGRSKKYYTLTKLGIAALQNTRQLQKRMWKDFNQLATEILETE